MPTDRRPRCPEQCRGHGDEGAIVCPRCGGVGYRVVTHEWPESIGHYWYTLEPAAGMPPLGPRQSPMCRDCGVTMVRR